MRMMLNFFSNSRQKSKEVHFQTSLFQGLQSLLLSTNANYVFEFQVTCECYTSKFTLVSKARHPCVSPLNARPADLELPGCSAFELPVQWRCSRPALSVESIQVSG